MKDIINRFTIPENTYPVIKSTEHVMIKQAIKKLTLNLYLISKTTNTSYLRKPQDDISPIILSRLELLNIRENSTKLFYHKVTRSYLLSNCPKIYHKTINMIQPRIG